MGIGGHSQDAQIMLSIIVAADAFTMPQAPRSQQHKTISMVESASLDTQILDRYMSLDVSSKVQAEYLFIDADGEVRSKCRTVDASKATLDQLPSWNYDGSSTNQAPGEDS